MPDTQAAEKKSIVGACEEISEKNGWTSFHINVGSQYPVRLSTKLPALIEKGRAVGGDTATWTFKESQGGENPNKPGTFYTNRYFDDVVVGEVAANGGTASGTTPSTTVAQAGAHREEAIIRQTCLKAAAALYQGLGQPVDVAKVVADDEAPIGSDPVVGALLRAAERMEQWVKRDESDLPF